MSICEKLRKSAGEYAAAGGVSHSCPVRAALTACVKDHTTVWSMVLRPGGLREPGTRRTAGS